MSDSDKADVIEQFEMAIYVALNLAGLAGMDKFDQADILAEAADVWRNSRDLYESKGRLLARKLRGLQDQHDLDPVCEFPNGDKTVEIKE